MKKQEIFIEIITNIYRTKHYIVEQRIGVKYDFFENDIIFSHDTFYRRTKARDKDYERKFADKKNIDGKRFKTSMYERTYVE